MNWEMAVLMGLKTLNLLLGGMITYYSYRAYRRTGRDTMRMVAAGFAIITLGAIVAGFLDRVPLFQSQLALVAEGTFTAVGFSLILYSLHI